MVQLAVGEEALDALTKKEVATRLRISPRTVDRLISRGELESVKIGRSRRVFPEAIIAYKNRLRAAGAAESTA